MASPESVLRGLRPDARLVAVGEGLRWATPDEAGTLAMLLLELASEPGSGGGGAVGAWVDLATRGAATRRADAAMLEIVRLWKRWPADLRQAALGVGGARWPGVIRRAAGSVEPRDRAAAAHLIAWAGLSECAGVAADLLTDDDRDAARAGGSALLCLAVRAAGLRAEELDPEWAVGPGAMDPEVDPRAREVVIEAVAGAAQAFGEQHRSREVLAAALLLADARDRPGRPTAGELRLAALIDRVDHPASGALRTSVRRTASPALVGRAWRWMSSASLGVSAAERLARASTPGERVAILEGAHLALHPARRRRLAEAPVRAGAAEGTVAPAGPLPGPEGWGGLDAHQRRGLVRLAALAPMEASVRRAVLSPALADVDAGVRLAAAASEPGELADFCFDADGRVARSAALRWSLAGTPASVRVPRHEADERRAALAARFARSPEPWVRRIGAEECERSSPWDAAGPTQRLAARRWLRSDPEGFDTAVRARVLRGEPGERVAALCLMRVLRLAARFERELIIAVGVDQPARVVATAVRVLGELRSAPALRATEAALRSADPRVRANAVEARLRQGGREGAATTHATMMELKGDAHHRVRAGALRGLIEGGAPTLDAAARAFDPAGVEGLGAMLADGRPEHRLAGVWLAERTLTGSARQRLGEAWVDLVGAIAGLASEDLSPTVRARAHRCARRLLVELRGAPEEAVR